MAIILTAGRAVGQDQGVPAGEAPARVQTSDAADREKESRRLAALSAKAFDQEDYPKAEEHLRQQLELDPDNFVILYNLACARSLQGDQPQAVEWLTKAVEHGFTDLRQLQSDASLNRVRAHPQYVHLVESWPSVLEQRRDAEVARLEKTYARGYSTVRDDKLKLVFRSAFSERDFSRAHAEIQLLAQWAEASVFGAPAGPDDERLDAWVTVVFPTRKDYVAWVVRRYGPDAINSFSTIGGAYSHDMKQLVSMDLGATMRHEFLHVLHWRSMTRLGQRHPIWVMEGLCSLVEDYDGVNEVIPATSWRTNAAKRLEKINKLTPIEKFCALSQASFTASRPLAQYAQARAIFLYLQQKGKLREWYAHYTDNFDTDPSGLASLMSVFGTEPKEFDKQFRAWLRDLPLVPEEVPVGRASLGVEVESGQGDGVVIARLARSRSSANGLRAGDVISAIDGRATRDIAELVRVLASFHPGDRVRLDVRRGKQAHDIELELVAKKP
jgi:hypothetical protein